MTQAADVASALIEREEKEGTTAGEQLARVKGREGAVEARLQRLEGLEESLQKREASLEQERGEIEAEVDRITAQLEQEQAQNTKLHNNLQLQASTLGQVRTRLELAVRAS